MSHAKSSKSLGPESIQLCLPGQQAEHNILSTREHNILSRRQAEHSANTQGMTLCQHAKRDIVSTRKACHSQVRRTTQFSPALQRWVGTGRNDKSRRDDPKPSQSAGQCAEREVVEPKTITAGWDELLLQGGCLAVSLTWATSAQVRDFGVEAQKFVQTMPGPGPICESHGSVKKHFQRRPAP